MLYIPSVNDSIAIHRTGNFPLKKIENILANSIVRDNLQLSHPSALQHEKSCYTLGASCLKASDSLTLAWVRLLID